MIRNYFGFGYRIEYSYVIKSNDTIDQSKRFISSVCFRQAFAVLDRRFGKIKATYKLKCKKHFEESFGNFCVLNKSQVLAILRYMRRVFEIKTHLTEYDDYYLITFYVEGKSVKHRFILTFSRVFFEFPYNEIAVDVFRLRNQGVIDGITYSNKSFLELYNVLLGTLHNYCGSGHLLINFPTIHDDVHSIRKAFKRGALNVQDVCPGHRVIYNKFREYDDNLRHSDWESTFELRMPIYSQNFKILKDEKSIYRRNRKELQ